MQRVVYLDHAATTYPLPAVLAAMQPFYAQDWGNPSSVYALGRRARAALDDARDSVADALGCRANEVIFHGSSAEADNLAICGVAFRLQGKGKHIVTTRVEHHAVLHTVEWLQRQFGFDVTYVDVDAYGRVDPQAVRAALRPDTILASVMLANNEVGTIQPVAEIAALCRERGVLIHTDAVQAAGYLDINVARLGVDLLTISGHKLYGPKGVGALYARRGTPLEPLLHGGGQERGNRSGTENVAGIVGLAAALRLAQAEQPERTQHAQRLRDRLIAGIPAAIPDVILTGHPQQRLPNFASFAIAGAEGDAILLNLDQRGICASSGSACTSGSLEVSHVLVAMRVPAHLAMGSLRLTTGVCNTDADVDAVLAALPEIVARVRQFSTVGAG